MSHVFISQLKEGDACLVENLAADGQEIYSEHFIEPATVKFLFGNSIVVEFDNADNRFRTPTMSFNCSGVIEKIKAKPVHIRLLADDEDNRGIIRRHERFKEMQQCIAAIGALRLDRQKFLAQEDNASRELLAQMQAVEMLLTQIYAADGDA
ncbi:MAG: hypothetical protein Q4A62_03700 [Eikenella sp.]|nr:hypothetical protein [Eikenella sp.]